jgi:putative ABC transport system permease protein
MRSDYLIIMIRNYFKIALRALIRNKAFTTINILGLVLGISFSTMLYIYVRHELSYDSYHQKSDQTYRILTIDKSNAGGHRTYGVTVPAMGPELVNSFPSVASMVRLHRFSGQVIVEVDGEKFNERNFFMTSDTNFFDVFHFDFVAGDPSTALSQPFSLIVTASTAKRYFGNESALDKMVTVPNVGEVKITGIIKDPPSNSHLQFDVLFSALRPAETWNSYLNNWERFSAFTYIVLHEGETTDALESQMPAFLKKHMPSDADLIAATFQPVEDIYLHSADVENGTEAQHGEISYVYIFSTMALFLLIIAAINYINLTTSKASSRAREIGIRKVAGAVKGQLIFQFLTEAFLITLVSMFLALVAMDLSLPYFNSITGKNFDLSFSTLKEFIPSLLLITAIIGIIAGSYPAFYLAKLKPVATLKGHSTFTPKKLDLRTVLVVFQFTITIVLIVSTMVIGNQMNFIQTKDIGFNKDQLMVIDINSGHVRRSFQAMKNEFSKLTGVESVAVSSRVPGEWKNITETYVKTTDKSETNADSLQTFFMGFDEDMLKTYKLRIVEGNYFTGSESDSSNVVINASAAEMLNLKNPIGATLRITANNGEWRPRVIGVLEDFNFQSLHQKISPIIIGYRNNPIQSIDYFTLKISGDPNQIIAEASKVHEKFDTQTPIEYHFLNDQLNVFYVAEQKAARIFKMGGILSIVVACLGLLGLANYHVERRTKELGIRKVLGAGSLNLFLLVSLSFTKQVAIAFVLACPVAWYIMTQWLGGFEYRTMLSADVFVAAGIIVLLLALLTVSYQSLKAAMFNPINSLRNE